MCADTFEFQVQCDNEGLFGIATLAVLFGSSTSWVLKLRAVYQHWDVCVCVLGGGEHPHTHTLTHIHSRTHTHTHTHIHTYTHTHKLTYIWRKRGLKSVCMCNINRILVTHGRGLDVNWKSMCLLHYDPRKNKVYLLVLLLFLSCRLVK